MRVREHVRKSKTLQARFEAEFESYEGILEETGSEPGVVPAGPPDSAEEELAPVRLPVAHRIVLEALGRLTPTERKVLEGWAHNLTNPQIGERLFISKRTVQTHLSHIFTKLGLSSRVELAAAASQRSDSDTVTRAP